MKFRKLTPLNKTVLEHV